MSEVSNRQALPTTSCDVEVNKDLTCPARFGVQRQKCTPQRAVIAVEAPTAIIRESSDASLAASTSPYIPCSPTVLTPPVAPLGSLLPSHLGAAVSEDPLPQSCPDQRQLDEDIVESEARLASSASAQQTGPSPPDHRSRYIQAFSLMTSMFGTTLAPANLIIVIRTGDRLIRDDAISFLVEQLPL
jgi:hypothetical protein